VSRPSAFAHSSGPLRPGRIITTAVSSHDDHVRSALDRVLESLKGQIESSLTASGDEILRAASEARLQAASEAAERAAEDGRQEAEHRLSSLRQELEREKEELQQRSADEVAALKRTIEEVREQLGAACLAIEGERQERESVEGQLEDSRRAAEESRRAADDVRNDVEAARQEVERIREERKGVRRELDAARAALARAGRLSDNLRSLDEGASLGEVLDGLLRGACQETGRAAVFLVRQNGIQGWRAMGFDENNVIVGVELVPEAAGLVGEAAQSGTSKERQTENGSDLPAFAAGCGPRHAVALPVEVGGSVIAVLYADRAEADSQDAARWPAILDVMARHAGRVLEAVTVRHAAALWAPRATGQGRLLRDQPLSSEGVQ